MLQQDISTAVHHHQSIIIIHDEDEEDEEGEGGIGDPGGDDKSNFVMTYS